MSWMGQTLRRLLFLFAALNLIVILRKKCACTLN